MSRRAVCRCKATEFKRKQGTVGPRTERRERILKPSGQYARDGSIALSASSCSSTRSKASGTRSRSRSTAAPNAALRPAARAERKCKSLRRRQIVWRQTPNLSATLPSRSPARSRWIASCYCSLKYSAYGNLKRLHFVRFGYIPTILRGSRRRGNGGRQIGDEVGHGGHRGTGDSEGDLRSRVSAGSGDPRRAGDFGFQISDWGENGAACERLFCCRSKPSTGRGPISILLSPKWGRFSEIVVSGWQISA
jgi:hypothetical protein